MKKNFLILFLILLSFKALSQENMITVGGGYSFANIEDSNAKGTGWRINGLYEFNPMGSKFVHGASFGYISLTSTETVGQQSVKNTINSFPIYYAPKVMFGSDRFKIFIKGALGMQIASLKREGPAVNLSDNDFGFYGGGGAGIMLFLKDNLFINGEYEIAWASNSFYKDGWINTAGGGIGFKF